MQTSYNNYNYKDIMHQSSLLNKHEKVKLGMSVIVSWCSSHDFNAF